MSVTFHIGLGTMIFLARRKLNLSGKELAEKVGVSQAYINDIELDRRSPKKMATLKKLAQALDLHLDVLCFSVGVLPPDIGEKDYSPQVIVAAFQELRNMLKLAED